MDGYELRGIIRVGDCSSTFVGLFLVSSCSLLHLLMNPTMIRIYGTAITVPAAAAADDDADNVLNDDYDNDTNTAEEDTLSLLCCESPSNKKCIPYPLPVD